MRRHLFGPTAGRTALLVAALLSLPFCWVGLFAHDYFHQLIIEGLAPMPLSPWELFTFATGEPAKLAPMITHGPYSWWALPELKFSFLRPLTCAIAQLDHLAFRRAFFFHHLHSIAWYLGLVAVVDGRMMETIFEQLMRASEHPVPLGMKVRLDFAEVTVLGHDQGLPNKISVQFDEPPERGGFTLVSWEGGELSPLSVPEIGRTVELPRVRSLLSP